MWEAAPAVALVIAGQLMLALLSRQQHWQLLSLGWWIWLVAGHSRGWCCSCRWRGTGRGGASSSAACGGRRRSA